LANAWVRVVVSADIAFLEGRKLVRVFEGRKVRKHSDHAGARKLREETDALFKRIRTMNGKVIVPLGDQQGVGIPFYCVHSIGGVVADLNELANQMGSGQQFYGIGSPMMYLTKEYGSWSVEDRAKYYVEELIKLQPTGSIALGGWSAGVAVALEMAHQLKDLGREVVLLVAIDWLPPMLEVELSGWRHALRLAHKVPLWIKKEKAVGNGSLWLLARRTSVLTFRVLSRTKRSPLDDWGIRKNLSRTHGEFVESFYEQLEKYDRKKPYDGRVLAIVAQTGPLFHLSIVKESWAKIANQLEVFCVKGAMHATIMKMPHVGLVARHLREQLNSIWRERH
jgi:thioesterase domain-containing protein